MPFIKFVARGSLTIREFERELRSSMGFSRAMAVRAGRWFAETGGDIFIAHSREIPEQIVDPVRSERPANKVVPDHVEIADKAASLISRYRDASAGYVYFVTAHGMVKIGFSQTPTRRIQSLKTAIPNLKTLCVVNGSRMLESQLHELFRNYNSKREWFYDGKHFGSLMRRLKPLSIAA